MMCTITLNILNTHQLQSSNMHSEIHKKGLDVINIFKLNSTELGFILLINVNVQTIVGVLTFISRRNATSDNFKASMF